MLKRKVRNNGGFVFVEFAIALPLLILLMYGLATVSLEIFRLGKTQLSDYALETEAQYVMEMITQEARAAKEIEIDNAASKIKIVYHTVDDDNEKMSFKDTQGKRYYLFTDKDILETQFFIPRKENGIYKTLNAKRQDDNILSTPITGGNSFGDTKINYLQFERDEKILHITLEMESLMTRHKIKIATAVFMPGYEIKGGSPNE